MDTNKVIVTLLVLTILMSVVTITFNAIGNNGVIVKMDKSNRADTATVSLVVEGGQPTTDGANVGLYVENVTP